MATEKKRNEPQGEEETREVNGGANPPSSDQEVKPIEYETLSNENLTKLVGQLVDNGIAIQNIVKQQSSEIGNLSRNVVALEQELGAKSSDIAGGILAVLNDKEHGKFVKGIVETLVNAVKGFIAPEKGLLTKGLNDRLQKKYEKAMEAELDIVLGLRKAIQDGNIFIQRDMEVKTS